MNFMHSSRATFSIAVIVAACFSQSTSLIRPSFSLSLSGTYGNGTEYRYLLNRTGDSGVAIVNGIERPVGWKDFRKVKSEIVNYAIELTEAAYGEPRDSTDFTGELALSALDRNSIIRLNAALTIGTLENGPMAGLLRLLMKQVDDTLRLPQIPLPESVK